jgi:hypothetical protein
MVTPPAGPQPQVFLLAFDDFFKDKTKPTPFTAVPKSTIDFARAGLTPASEKANQKLTSIVPLTVLLELSE